MSVSAHGVMRVGLLSSKITLHCPLSELLRGHHGAFPSLTALSLGGVASLSDKDVALLLTPPHWHGSSSSSSFVKEDVGDRLHSLNLRGCPLLTDASLLILRRHCRCLRSLDLSHLPLATAEGLSQVFEQVGTQPNLCLSVCVPVCLCVCLFVSVCLCV